jgi:hypothetical protein
MQRTGARIYILKLLLILCCIIIMIATHPHAFSRGGTPLKWAINENKPDVVALLRSVGASLPSSDDDD